MKIRILFKMILILVVSILGWVVTFPDQFDYFITTLDEAGVFENYYRSNSTNGSNFLAGEQKVVFAIDGERQIQSENSIHCIDMMPAQEQLLLNERYKNLCEYSGYESISPCYGRIYCTGNVRPLFYYEEFLKTKYQHLHAVKFTEEGLTCNTDCDCSIFVCKSCDFNYIFSYNNKESGSLLSSLQNTCDSSNKNCNTKQKYVGSHKPICRNSRCAYEVAGLFVGMINQLQRLTCK